MSIALVGRPGLAYQLYQRCYSHDEAILSGRPDQVRQVGRHGQPLDPGVVAAALMGHLSEPHVQYLQLTVGSAGGNNAVTGLWQELGTERPSLDWGQRLSLDSDRNWEQRPSLDPDRNWGQRPSLAGTGERDHHLTLAGTGDRVTVIGP